jgi:hypothetical protein
LSELLRSILSPTYPCYVTSAFTDYSHQAMNALACDFNMYAFGSANLVLFASSDLLWCPAGLVDMTTGSISPYAIQIPDVPPKKDERSLV